MSKCVMYRIQKKTGWESIRYIWGIDIVGFGRGGRGPSVPLNGA